MAALDISPLPELFGSCHQWALTAQLARQEAKWADKMSRADSYCKHLYQPSHEYWQHRYLPGALQHSFWLLGQTLPKAQENCQNHPLAERTSYRNFKEHLQAPSITDDRKTVIFRKRKCQQSRILAAQQGLISFPKSDKVRRQQLRGKPQYKWRLLFVCLFF